MPWVKERSARNGWALQFLRCASESFPRGLFPGRDLRRFRGTGIPEVPKASQGALSRLLSHSPAVCSKAKCLLSLAGSPGMSLLPPCLMDHVPGGRGSVSPPRPVRPVCSVRPVLFRPASASPGGRRPSFKKKTRSFHPLTYYGGSASPVQDKRRDWR